MRSIRWTTDPRALAWAASLSLVLGLQACGGGGTPTAAQRSDARAAQVEPGPTPFIGFVNLDGSALAEVREVRFEVAPREGATARPVRARFSAQALARRGDLAAGGTRLRLPVFGLYAGQVNPVTLELAFPDGSVQRLAVDIAAPPYADPTGRFDRPRVLQPRAIGSALGFDYLLLKSALTGPLVIDTDGEIRWAFPRDGVSYSTRFHDNAFVVGDATSTRLRWIGLDGTVREGRLDGPGYTQFHHHIDPGKQGLLAEMDARIGGVPVIESLLAEFGPQGTLLRAWDFGELLARHMREHGDDPAAFVRPGTDWFHMNAATYDPRDDSLIVSSRENFVIKVDYATGAIRWILGDPTKYWYRFASLRAKALVLEGGGWYPIGQHATSLTADGRLLLFNNGEPSRNQPADAPVGQRLDRSVVAAYDIDPVAMTAREAWRFDAGPALRSPFCSSAYQAGDGSMLVNYAMAGGTTLRLIGLDPARRVAFDFEYPTTGCGTSWNAEPIAFEALRFE